MKPSFYIFVCSALALVLTACAQIKESSNRLEESHLRDAGFKIMLADSQDRQDMLRTLPADSVTRIQHGDAVYYVYPDPDGCVCLYVGRESEYQRLQQLAVEREVSDEQMRINDMKADSQMGLYPMGYWGSWINNNPGRPDWDPH